MNLVVDADGLLYRSGFAAEKRTYLVGELEFASKAEARAAAEKLGVEVETWVDVEPVANVLHTLRLQIESMQRAVEQEYGRCGRTLVVLSGPVNYRYEVATIKPYKGNRDPEHKPYYLHEMRDYLKRRFGAVESKGVEADDVVAQIGTSNRGRIVMSSMDKDLLQVPGLHYDYLHDVHLEIDDEVGLCNLYEQIISGDPTDNIPGCYRVGKAGAAQLVDAIRESTPRGELALLEQRLYRGALNCYEQSLAKYGEQCPYYGMSAADALCENARLVYLKRSKDDQWEPPLLD